MMDIIIDILQKRDGISENEARNIVEDCLDEMNGAIMRADYQECEDILMLYLGLEPDYLDYLLDIGW